MIGLNFHEIIGSKSDLLTARFPFHEKLPLFASNLLIQVEASSASEMPKKEKACKEFGRDFSDSNTPIYFSSTAFLGPVFADETYKQTGRTCEWVKNCPKEV